MTAPPTHEDAFSPWAGVNWLDQIARHAHQIPDRTAFRFEERSISWKELRRRIQTLAGALAHSGVGTGDRVVVLMTNRPELMEVVLAANLLGAIAVPVNYRLSAEEVHYIVADSGAAALVASHDTAGVADKARAALTGPALYVMTGAVPASSGAVGYEDLVDGPVWPLPQASIGERTPALIMYTSGTTGRPKGAVLSHLNLSTQTVTGIRHFQLIRDDDVALCASPMFHIAAFCLIASMISLGCSTVILPSGQFDADTVLDVVGRERVTHLFLVPAQWQLVVARPDAGRRASHLRVLSWGAAPATVGLLDAIARTFPGVANVAVFGQTEMSPTTCVLGGEDAKRKIGSVGRPIASTMVRVVDDDMNDVPRGEIGEIVYRGPSVMAGYWNNPEATADAFAGGWFHSGDLVRQDDEGFIYVVDRKKDMIISGGENIYCAEVENVLSAHPAVADVALVGGPHPRWGETPVAVVVPADPAEPPTLEDLTAWCQNRLASYKKPTCLLVVDELPRNAAGKVVKPVLRELFTKGSS